MEIEALLRNLMFKRFLFRLVCMNIYMQKRVLPSDFYLMEE